MKYRELFASSQQAFKVRHGVLTCSLGYSLLLIASRIVAGGVVVSAGCGTATSEAAIATDSRRLILGRASAHLRRILWTRDVPSHSLAAHASTATDSRWLILWRASTHVVVLWRVLWTCDSSSHSLAAAHGRHAAHASTAAAKSSVRTILWRADLESSIARTGWRGRVAGVACREADRLVIRIRRLGSCNVHGR